MLSIRNRNMNNVWIRCDGILSPTELDQAFGRDRRQNDIIASFWLPEILQTAVTTIEPFEHLVGCCVSALTLLRRHAEALFASLRLLVSAFSLDNDIDLIEVHRKLKLEVSLNAAKSNWRQTLQKVRT